MQFICYWRQVINLEKKKPVSISPEPRPPVSLGTCVMMALRELPTSFDVTCLVTAALPHRRAAASPVARNAGSRPALFVGSDVPQNDSNFFGERWEAAPGRSQNRTSDRCESQTNGHNLSHPVSETSSSGLGSFALRDRGQRGIGLPP